MWYIQGQFGPNVYEKKIKLETTRRGCKERGREGRSLKMTQIPSFPPDRIVGKILIK